MSEDENITEENSKQQIANKNEEVNENNSQEEPIELSQPQTPDLQLQSENMEVHKHPHHVMHAKNWKEYLLEFLMIFLAVTLGFFAESYREYSAEKSRAAEYARSLVHDLEKDTAMVRVDIENIEFLSSKIDSLVNFLRDKKIDDITNVELFAHTHFICLYRPYSWSRATLEEIKSSGSLRYFDNDSIIMRISAYDALTKHLDADFNGDEERSNRVRSKKESHCRYKLRH